MAEGSDETKNWCDQIAGIIVDAMLDAKLIEKEIFDEAVDVASLELFVRLTCGDYPPSCNPKISD